MKEDVEPAGRAEQPPDLQVGSPSLPGETREAGGRDMDEQHSRFMLPLSSLRTADPGSLTVNVSEVTESHSNLDFVFCGKLRV